MEDQVEASGEAESLFSALYKYNGKSVKMSQQQRREQLLEEQKQKRHQITDQGRQACEQFIREIDMQELQEEMECEPITPSKNKKFKFKLMQSEWFTEIPDDLEDNWLVKVSPQGFRVLLVAQNHITICYNKQGNIILKIKSNFPGGGNHLNGITILDCIINKSIKTIFVLDCLFWNSMSMLESEASFRFFWLKSKFEENPHLAKHRQYNFRLLDYMPAQRPLIQDEMFKDLIVENHRLPYDGVVFYHKESHYTFGYTPLVGWLASYMLPEKLHIDVSPSNMIKKPKDYICMETYLEKRNSTNKKRRSYTKRQSEVESQMDTH